MSKTSDMRRHDRLDCDTRGRAVWTDRTGQNKWAIVRIFDLSQAGVRLELPEPVEGRAVISFSSDDMKLQGQATVRFCRRQGTKYIVGAEFVGGMSWKSSAPVHK
jgi:hypothetical protein